jgi:hypothetical protein
MLLQTTPGASLRRPQAASGKLLVLGKSARVIADNLLIRKVQRLEPEADPCNQNPALSLPPFGRLLLASSARPVTDR